MNHIECNAGEKCNNSLIVFIRLRLFLGFFTLSQNGTRSTRLIQLSVHIVCSAEREFNVEFEPRHLVLR